MNLLSLINPSLAHIYCSTTLSNHGLIRLNRFVLQISLNMCNQFCNQSMFNTLNQCQTSDMTGTKVQEVGTKHLLSRKRTSFILTTQEQHTYVCLLHPPFYFSTYTLYVTFFLIFSMVKGVYSRISCSFCNKNLFTIIKTYPGIRWCSVLGSCPYCTGILLHRTCKRIWSNTFKSS